MRLIPFLPMFHEKILDGTKTMTCRTKRYGREGDILQGPEGSMLFLEKVYPKRLVDVAEDDYEAEGCEDPRHFWTIWTRLHPSRTDTDLIVYVHRFHVVPQGGSDAGKD